MTELHALRDAYRSDKAALLREARAFFPNTIQAEQGLSLSL